MKTYRTNLGDMWDSIARRVYPSYGGEHLMTMLIDANPAHRETTIFSGGVMLNIPEVAAPTVRSLPPWKR
jgi:phage tail protein X